MGEFVATFDIGTCKKCGVDCMRYTSADLDFIRPRKMSFCKGYKRNAFDPKTNICKTIIRDDRSDK